MFKPNATMITMTANDVTMDSRFSFSKGILVAFKIINIDLKDYLTHQGVNLHMTSVLVYLLTYQLSTVRTQTLIDLVTFPAIDGDGLIVM